MLVCGAKPVGQAVLAPKVVFACTKSPTTRHCVQTNAVASDFHGLGRMEREGYNFTSERGWDYMREHLKMYKVDLISAQEVQHVLDNPLSTTVVIDVRPQTQYEGDHIVGSINVPFYQPITGWTPWKILRRTGFAIFGILNGTELNDNFVQDVKKLVKDKTNVILVCGIGGSIDASPDQVEKAGRQSRSLIAAFEIAESVGGIGVQVLKGGFYQWAKAGRRSSASI